MKTLGTLIRGSEKIKKKCREAAAQPRGILESWLDCRCSSHPLRAKPRGTRAQRASVCLGDSVCERTALDGGSRPTALLSPSSARFLWKGKPCRVDPRMEDPGADCRGQWTRCWPGLHEGTSVSLFASPAPVQVLDAAGPSGKRLVWPSKIRFSVTRDLPFRRSTAATGQTWTAVDPGLPCRLTSTGAGALQAETFLGKGPGSCSVYFWARGPGCGWRATLANGPAVRPWRHWQAGPAARAEPLMDRQTVSSRPDWFDGRGRAEPPGPGKDLQEGLPAASDLVACLSISIRLRGRPPTAGSQMSIKSQHLAREGDRGCPALHL